MCAHADRAAIAVGEVLVPQLPFADTLVQLLKLNRYKEASIRLLFLGLNCLLAITVAIITL